MSNQPDPPEPQSYEPDLEVIPDPPQPPPPTPEPAPLPTSRAALWREIERDTAAGGGEATPTELRKSIRALPSGMVPAGTYRRVSFDLWIKFSDYSARYNAHTGKQVSMNFSALADNPGNTMPTSEGIKAAADLLKPPEDAVLEMAEYDECAGAPFFVAVWRHVVGGVPVERDILLAMVNGRSRRVFNWQRIWHTVDTKAGPR